MFDALKLIHENRRTSLMLLSVMVLYSGLFFAGFFTPQESGPSALKNESGFTAGELKEKEETARQNLMAQPKLAATLSFLLLAVLAAGLAMDAYLLMRGFRERPWAGAFSQAVVARWGLREVMQAFVFMFFIEGVIFIAQTFWGLGHRLGKNAAGFFSIGQ